MKKPKNEPFAKRYQDSVYLHASNMKTHLKIRSQDSDVPHASPSVGDVCQSSTGSLMFCLVAGTWLDAAALLAENAHLMRVFAAACDHLGDMGPGDCLPDDFDFGDDDHHCGDPGCTYCSLNKVTSAVPFPPRRESKRHDKKIQ